MDALFRILLKTTIRSFGDDWHVRRFSLPSAHLASPTGPKGKTLYAIGANDRSLTTGVALNLRVVVEEPEHARALTDSSSHRLCGYNRDRRSGCRDVVNEPPYGENMATRLAGGI